MAKQLREAREFSIYCQLCRNLADQTHHLQKRSDYFKGFWDWIEFLTLVLRITCVAMYAMKKLAGKVAVEDVVKHEYGNNFITAQTDTSRVSFKRNKHSLIN